MRGVRWSLEWSHHHPCANSREILMPCIAHLLLGCEILVIVCSSSKLGFALTCCREQKWISQWARSDAQSCRELPYPNSSGSRKVHSFSFPESCLKLLRFWKFHEVCWEREREREVHSCGEFSWKASTSCQVCFGSLISSFNDDQCLISLSFLENKLLILHVSIGTAS